MIKKYFLPLVFLVSYACTTHKTTTQNTYHSPLKGQNERNIVLGKWRMGEIRNLVTTDTALLLVDKAQLIKLLTTKVTLEIYPDSTYVDHSFEGDEYGTWRLDHNKWFYKIHKEGGIDTLIFSSMEQDVLKGTFRTAEGARADFKLIRIN